MRNENIHQILETQQSALNTIERLLTLLAERMDAVEEHQVETRRLVESRVSDEQAAMRRKEWFEKNRRES